MAEKIRVVLAEPGKPARAVEIENSYEAIRDAVGGPITTWRTGVPGTVCYVHDEALLEGLPWNRCHRPSKTYLAGNILAMGDDGRGGERSMTAEETVLTLGVLNHDMELMDASRSSSLEELEELTGEPAAQFIVAPNTPAEAFEIVRQGLAGAKWERLAPPSEKGFETVGARGTADGWTVLVVAFRPRGEPEWRADGTIAHHKLGLVVHMTPEFAMECAKAAGLVKG